MAEQGSVLFMYERKGAIDLVITGEKEFDEEALLEAAVEAGVEDYEVVEGDDEEGTISILTDPKEASLMLEAVKSIMGYDDDEKIKLSLKYISKAPVEVSEDDFEKNMGIIDALEELDDVDCVEHNMSN